MAGEAKGADRAYAEIKRRILIGELRLRERLDIEALARSLKLSITPVRYALTRLSAERLIAAQGVRGYFVAMWSERELKALYEWRGALTLLALKRWRAAPNAEPAAATAAYEDRLAHLLRRIESGANLEIERAAENASERLYPAFAVESEVLTGAEAHLDALEHAIEAANGDETVALIEDLFERRANEAGAIRKRAAMRALPNGA